MSGESAFASLCGASPVEAPGGKVKRHRLNRGGDRQANRALHTIARQRMKRDSRTKLYVDKRTKEGKSRREIERILVRYIAREVYGALMRPMDAACEPYRASARAAKSERLRAGAAQAQASPRPRRGERADKRDGKGGASWTRPFSKGTGAGLRACPPEKDGKAQNRA